eukprot:3095595-Pyramimonas_sp.AAC.1
MSSPSAPARDARRRTDERYRGACPQGGQFGQSEGARRAATPTADRESSSDVQDSQKLGSVCFKRGLVPRTYPFSASDWSVVRIYPRSVSGGGADDMDVA